ncbi:MAG TPA: hypothetical protein DCX92_04970 [Bacteroidetes bacterium]|nr:hypothetical protein [Bacteroidota bacterium]
MESILKNLLQKKGCYFEKYLSKIQYIKTKDDIRESVYLTPAFTPKNKKVLFITREVKGNWFDSVKDIDDLKTYITNNSSYAHGDYIFILHVYIENIRFEQFYLMHESGGKKLQRIPADELEKVLE